LINASFTPFNIDLINNILYDNHNSTTELNLDPDGVKVEAETETEKVTLKEVLVTNMYYGCMYPKMPNPIAAYDCCGAHAVTTVELPNGYTTWRCAEHRGLIEDGITGPVSETTLTDRDVDPRSVIREVSITRPVEA